MRYGLIGEKLGHSYSPEIHEALGLYSYELVEIAPADLDAFMTERDFSGINVTIPYKQAVLPYLDSMSERARAVGAVNTIVNRNGSLYGDNTDVGGLAGLIERMGLDLHGKTVLIAGTGGASKAALAVAQEFGAKETVLLSRSERNGALTYEDAYARFANAEILINTTPVGMYPDVDGIPVVLERLPHLDGVVDVVYNPIETRLVKEARARGIKAESGLYMLVAQALLSAELFSGQAFSESDVEEAYERLLTEKAGSTTAASNRAAHSTCDNDTPNKEDTR